MSTRQAVLSVIDSLTFPAGVEAVRVEASQEIYIEERAFTATFLIGKRSVEHSGFWITVPVTVGKDIEQARRMAQEDIDILGAAKQGVDDPQVVIQKLADSNYRLNQEAKVTA